MNATTAKVVELYSGYDSLGRDVELVKSETNKWFWRRKVNSRYSSVWTKWDEYTDEVTHPKRLLNMSEYAGAPVYIELTDEQSKHYVEWGFMSLRLTYNRNNPAHSKYNVKYRLPI